MPIVNTSLDALSHIKSVPVPPHLLDEINRKIATRAANTLSLRSMAIAAAVLMVLAALEFKLIASQGAPKPAVAVFQDVVPDNMLYHD